MQVEEVETGARTAQGHYQQTGPSSSVGPCGAWVGFCGWVAWLKPCPSRSEFVEYGDSTLDVTGVARRECGGSRPLQKRKERGTREPIASPNAAALRSGSPESRRAVGIQKSRRMEARLFGCRNPDVVGGG